MEISLTVEELAASYGARTVFAGVSLQVRRGEVLVVSGSNGSGKSTFLRLLAGLQQPSAGIAVYACAGRAWAPREAGPIIGWVAPDLALYRELTARENLRFFADVRRLSLGDTEIDDLLVQVGLGGRGNDRLSAYSSGMAYRLRYAYALIHRPPVLLLDEPTVTLDTRGAEVVDQVIARQRREGIVVVATNDPRELRYADLLLQLGSP
ncbi:ABC transporter ATP-binding protein [Oscillochloris sp. ZM17-4]|uniref:ABC transporter ATP-binding protein n=1 Tax=Oscillochloris sp. ZM17-4 TaxID=2866714 RepID=UPI001C73DC85|nr:ABC transporter ATP-binding protein [Oscillochloris sp. ZM17-4]MBX0327079.1 ABC transporter ATP-binding protein [Oscillochloris sp. ZM17-4]